MVKSLLSLLLALFLSITPSLAIVPEMDNYFVAVINSKDLGRIFIEYPKLKKDYCVDLRNWNELPEALDEIAKKAGNNPILLDFNVHGYSDGLYVKDLISELRVDFLNHKMIYRESRVLHRASFGYIVNQIEKHFKGKKFVVGFESCLAASAYRNTIR